MKHYLALLMLLCTGLSKAQVANYSVDVTQGCVPLSVSFQNLSTGSVSYYWDFGDALSSVLEHPVHIFYGANQTYDVMLVAVDSMGDSDTIWNTITTQGAVPFFNLQDSACPGELINLSAYGNQEPGNLYQWDLDNGSVLYGEDVQLAYQDTGSYIVTLQMTNNSCGVVYDSALIIVSNTIFPPIHIHPENLDPVICVGGNFPWFYDENLFVNWEFGDGESSSDPYPFHLYDSLGIYNVQISITNECGNTSLMDTSIQVEDDLVPAATYYAGPMTRCSGELITFYAAQSFGNSYAWWIDDTIAYQGEVIQHMFNDLATHTIQLVVENLCGNTDTANGIIITVDDLIPPVFASVLSNVICPNESTTLSGGGGYDSLFWLVNGDTINSRFPLVNFSAVGVYPVEYHVVNGCGNEGVVYDTVWVVDTIPLSLTAIISSGLVCVNEQVQFSSEISNLFNYQWSFGDGEFGWEEVVYHSYSDTGVYNVMLVAGNGCGYYDTVHMQLQVDTISFPILDFDYDYSPGACAGVPVEFSNLSSDTVNSAWDFGDGGNSLLTNPTYEFINQGNFLVQLTVQNSCGNSGVLTKLVSVSGEAPSANINLDDSSMYCLGEVIDVENQYQTGWFNSVWSSSWEGIDVFSLNYSMTLDEPGVHELELVVDNECGIDSQKVSLVVLDDLNTISLGCDSVNGCLEFTWGSQLVDFFQFQLDGNGWEDAQLDTNFLMCAVGPGALSATMQVRGVRGGVCPDTIYSDTATCSMLVSVIEVSEVASIRVFPSPSAGVLHIQSVDKFSKILMLDLLGNQIFKHELTQEDYYFELNVEFLANGVYILQIAGARFLSSNQVIIQK